MRINVATLLHPTVLPDLQRIRLLPNDHLLAAAVPARSGSEVSSGSLPHFASYALLESVLIEKPHGILLRNLGEQGSDLRSLDRSIERARRGLRFPFA